MLLRSMMNYVTIVSSLVLLTLHHATCQDVNDLLLTPPIGGRAGQGLQGLRRRCALPCRLDYVPGTCLCQDNILFPFLFTATQCMFANCAEGEVCRMQQGRAVCVTITRDTPTVDVCNLPADPGPCRVYVERFFFDRNDGTCKTFIYGGCHGNGNKFDTKSECERKCIVDVPPTQGSLSRIPRSAPSGSTSPQQRAICQLPASPGRCFAYFPSYFFNANSNRCEQFVYGGCQGNENRFQSLEECERACPTDSSASGAQSPVLSSNPDCNLPQAAGLCLAYFPSFFYNTQTGQCESFVYGGCQGNANRFATKEQCDRTCRVSQSKTSPTSTRAACLQPKQTGPCRAAMPRWFFSQASQACEMFIYGGCGANDNFNTQSECESSCVTGSGVPSPISERETAPASSTSGRSQRCSLPSETGPCRARMPRFYFNTNSGSCEMFFYGGCRGNENRFSTREECEGTCRPTSSQTQQQQQQQQQQQNGNAASEDACSQSKVVGPCRAAIRRYYYNSTTGRCERFIFGGCNGNQNNFRSFRDCQRKCGGGTLRRGGRRRQL